MLGVGSAEVCDVGFGVGGRIRFGGWVLMLLLLSQGVVWGVFRQWDCLGGGWGVARVYGMVVGDENVDGRLEDGVVGKMEAGA